jgi:hypothetical protein
VYVWKSQKVLGTSASAMCRPEDNKDLKQKGKKLAMSSVSTHRTDARSRPASVSEELGLLAKQLASASDAAEAAPIRKHLTRAFYGQHAKGERVS